ncbi:MAG: DUF6799 domain-containing protein [Ferruginibacter sp.]
MKRGKMILAIVKSIFTIALFFAVGSATAQTKAHPMKMHDCCMMKDGKMMVMKNGKTMPMTKDMTMKDGTKCMTNGEYTMKDGTKMTMKDGDCMDMNGKMCTDKMKEMSAAMYSCPMHPEVTSNKPGKCSKCGMALVKKKMPKDGKM